MKPKVNHSDILFLIEKLKKFMAEPLINKINMISNLYDLLKTATFYRYSFKSIGKFSVIKKPILINNPQFVSIGERVQIRNGMRLEVLAYEGEKTPQLTIGNFTNIEQNLHLICHSRIKIGDYVTINANCCIVDLTHPYDDIDETLKIGARVLKEDSFIEIGDETFIGFGSVILPNVKIGKHVVIGANSVVTKDIPSYSVVAGIPAKIIKKYVPETKTWEKV